MTKLTRVGTSNVTVGCFPDEKLLEALSKLLSDADGVPTDFRIVGKARVPGDLERPVAKFHGREVEVVTSTSIVRFKITDA